MPTHRGNESSASWLASLPAAERDRLLGKYTGAELERLWWDWKFWARPNQLAPDGDWLIWLLLAGRGFGKTRTGAEWIRERVKQGAARWIALIAKNPADARDVMIEGPAGILRVSPPDERPRYEPSKRRLVWKNGAQATVFSAYEPDQLRGPQHDTLWADELASWEYLRETWDMAMFGLRLGDHPQAVVTTTPRPLTLLKEFLVRPDVRTTTGSTYENIENLAPAFFQQVVSKYEGTSLGEQELHARILEEAEGALWNRTMFLRAEKVPTLVRVVVGVDPALSSNEESNETGIVVAGVDAKGRGYLLGDKSGRFKPDGWARRAVTAYHAQDGDRIVAEANNGGEMVSYTIHTVDPKVPVRLVHASKGKHTRAEPVAALYEQGKVFHVGTFPELEDQLCSWVPGDDSPDRLDAAVWALTDLMLTHRPALAVSPGGLGQENPWHV